MKVHSTYSMYSMILISVLVIGLTAVDGVSYESVSNTNHQISSFLGKDVVNQQGEFLGRIRDFMVDSGGRIEFAIISLADPNKKYVAVPFAAVSYELSTDRFTFNMSGKRLASAPGFDRDQNLTDSKFAEEVYGYFGLGPYWTEDQGEGLIRSDEDPFDLVG